MPLREPDHPEADAEERPEARSDLSRACDACRKMKIRCIDKENPPCKRCRHMKLECRFAPTPVLRPKSSAEQGEATKHRLDSLEGQVLSMNHKLDEISSFLLCLPAMSSGSRPGSDAGSASSSGAGPGTATASDTPRTGNGDGHGHTLRGPRSFGSGHGSSALSDRSGRRGYPPQSSERDTAHARCDDRREKGEHHLRASSASSAPAGSRGRSLQFTEYDHDVATMSPMNRLRPTAPDGYRKASGVWSERGATAAAAAGGGSSSDGAGAGVATGTRERRRPSLEQRRHLADEDDPLEAAVRMEPFRGLTMKEEEARLRGEGHSAAGSRGHAGNGRKRRRLSGDGDSGGGGGDSSASNAHSPVVHSPADLVRGDDPVDLGYCTEAEGKELFDAFFAHAHCFIPILDPSEDTWDDLRARSPLCITVILLIALRGREGCGPPSELTRRCRAQAEAMAKVTLFSPISTLETVQALTLMASFSDSSWRPGCHAMTLAVDMGLFRCLPLLHRLGTGDTAGASVESQRPLVVGARIWLALVKLTYEMSLTHALPLPFPSPAHYPYHHARELLAHPLSNVWDTRLVVSVEMLQVRETVARPYDEGGAGGGAAASGSDLEGLEGKLRAVNEDINTRFEYWLDYYQRHGLPSDHFLVRELTSQRAYATIYTNNAALHGVRDASDIATLSLGRRQCLGAALRAAAFLVASIGSGAQEKNSEFANHYFHVGIVATARYLLRMVGLLPEVCDLHQVSYDIDKLLLKLPVYPGHPFTEVLRSATAKARQDGVLPYTLLSDEQRDVEVDSVPTERPDAPAAHAAHGPASEHVLPGSEVQVPGGAVSHGHDHATGHGLGHGHGEAGLVPTGATSVTGSLPWNTPLHHPSQSGLDQLGQLGKTADVVDESVLWLNDWNLAAWFPHMGSAEANAAWLAGVQDQDTAWLQPGGFPSTAPGHSSGC